MSVSSEQIWTQGFKREGNTGMLTDWISLRLEALDLDDANNFSVGAENLVAKSAMSIGMNMIQDEAGMVG